MGILGHFKDIVTFVTIFSLFGVGLVIVVRSGRVAVGADRSRLVLANLSEFVITLAGCILALGMIQQLIGFRLPERW